MPYSSTRRKRPHCARRIFLNPRTGPGTRCDFGQNGQTNRVPCAFAIRSTMTAQLGLHSLYSTGSGGATATLTNGRTGLVLFAVTRLAARLAGRLRRAAVRVVRVARIASTLTGRLSVRRQVSRFRYVSSLLPALDNVLVGALVVPRLLS
jgi:hypothetical protein